MTKLEREKLFEIAKNYLDKAIYAYLPGRMPNGSDLAGAIAHVITAARSYFMDEAIRLGVADSFDDKKCLAVFYSAVDDYVFGKVLDAISRVQASPVQSPMRLIFGSDAKIPG